jgi:hypothetical protein
MDTGATLIGLVRDVIAAALGLAILFNLNISDEQIAGVLLLVTTIGALATWAYNVWRAQPPA